MCKFSGRQLAGFHKERSIICPAGLYGYYELLLKVFDKFTIAMGFPQTDLASQVDGSAVAVPPGGFSIGSPVTQITPDGMGGNITNEEALAYGRININTIIEDAQSPVYSSIRLLAPFGSMAHPMIYSNPLKTYLRNGEGFGEPNAGYFAGLARWATPAK